MLKKTLYPKTSRIGKENNEIIITEKLDGSNLTFANVDGKLIIAQRNYVFTLDTIKENKQLAYKGLIGWLDTNADALLSELHKNSAITGEWIGMGHLPYEFDNRFFMFAKGNINEDLDLVSLRYNPELFIYPFKSQEIPSFISVVPVVGITESIPSVLALNSLYDYYINDINRNVEGFIINNNDSITKYVRMKNGKLSEHKQ